MQGCSELAHEAWSYFRLRLQHEDTLQTQDDPNASKAFPNLPQTPKLAIVDQT